MLPSLGTGQALIIKITNLLPLAFGVTPSGFLAFGAQLRVQSRGGQRPPIISLVMNTCVAASSWLVPDDVPSSKLRRTPSRGFAISW